MNANDEILEDFYNFIFNVALMPIITVYYNTSDYPGIFVARLFYSIPCTTPTKFIIKGETEQEIQEKIPNVFEFIHRFPQDEEHILGAYI